MARFERVVISGTREQAKHGSQCKQKIRRYWTTIGNCSAMERRTRRGSGPTKGHGVGPEIDDLGSELTGEREV